MILSINPVDLTVNLPSYHTKKQKLREDNSVSNPNEEVLSGVPKSYIAFRAAQEEKPIHFTDEAKDMIYKNFFNSLKTHGVLFIGSTEQISNYKDIGFNRMSSFYFEKP